MIQQESRLKVADNTGAKELLTIRVKGGSMRDMRRWAMRSSQPSKAPAPRGAPAKGDIVRAVIVRTRRASAVRTAVIRFDDNAL